MNEGGGEALLVGVGVGVGQDSVSPSVKWKGGAWKISSSPFKSRIPCHHCSKQTGVPFGDLSSERSKASDFSTPVAWNCETDNRMSCKSAGVVEKIWAGRQMCASGLEAPLCQRVPFRASVSMTVRWEQ